MAEASIAADLHEYAFDIELTAVARVKAADEWAARKMLGTMLQGVEPSEQFIDGFNSEISPAQVTEMSFNGDTDEATLFEVDGDAVKDVEWVRCAKEHGLEIRKVAEGYAGRYDESWVTDTFPTMAEVAQDWCELEGHEP